MEDMQARRSQAVSVVAVLVTVMGLLFALTQVAFGFHTDGREKDYACNDCHVSFSGGSDESSPGVGPHGLYRRDTKKCRMCHSVHHAPIPSIKLLQAATIQDACFTCHDSTGGDGVYSGIEARGGSVSASHSIDTTSVIPGGSVDLTANLTCISCHTVHRATAMQPFARANGAAFAPEVPLMTDSLLRDDVGGAARGTYTQYGGAWCAGCHDQRAGGATPMHNHPTSETVPYEINRFLDPNNEKFITTGDPRPEPYCQQCHNNSMDIASPNTYEGLPADNSMNPQFGFFPHQTTNEYLLVEVEDDLCMNCHTPSELP